MRIWIRLCMALAVIATMPWPAAAIAQSWPNGPIKIVVPVPPGGGTDTLARAVAAQLQNSLNVSVVVENKPGASALIGTEFVAKAHPDGNTLLMGYSVLATNKFLVKSLPYDLEQDLVPVAYIGYIPLMLVTSPSLPVNNVQDLIALSKASPGKYSYASGGAGSSSHLSGEMLKSKAALDIVHIPYKGDAPALNDVVAGHVPMVFITITTALPMVKAGNSRHWQPRETRDPRSRPMCRHDRVGGCRIRDEGLEHDLRSPQDPSRHRRAAERRHQHGHRRPVRAEAIRARCDLCRRHDITSGHVSARRDRSVGRGDQGSEHQGGLTMRILDMHSIGHRARLRVAYFRSARSTEAHLEFNAQVRHRSGDGGLHARERRAHHP